jgi:hypothetical protein
MVPSCHGSKAGSTVTATTRVGVKPGGSVGTIVCRWDRRMEVM